MGNYHPLTMLSYSIEYQLFGLNPFYYHLDNLILHLLVCILIYILTYQLVSSWFIAFFTAIVFGIHPMHVESVAWISERKDLLYAFFYFFSLVVYMKYRDSLKIKWLLFSSLLFVLSLLSKGMALTLPIAMLLIDHFQNRGDLKKAIAEKIPLLALSILFGVWAIKAQASFNYLRDVHDHDFFNQILFACNALMLYIVKLLAPLQLSAFYPYPEAIGSQQYLSLVAVLMLIATMIWSFSKNRMVFFGLGFFMLSVSLVLQFLSFGGAMMADRYTYVPYFGLLLLSGSLLSNLRVTLSKTVLNTGAVILSMWILIMGYLGHERVKIWENSFTLWDDVIAKYPKLWDAYSSRAAAYIDIQNYSAAIKDYGKAIQLNPGSAALHYNRGFTYMQNDQDKKAIEDLQRSIQVDEKYVVAYNALATIHAKDENWDEALALLDGALDRDNSYAEAWYNKALILNLSGNRKDALIHLKRAVQLDPSYSGISLPEPVQHDAPFYIDQGNKQMKGKQFNDAVRSFTKALTLDPKYADTYNNRGSAYWNLKQYQLALEDYNEAIDIDPVRPEFYFNRAAVFKELNNLDAAMLDYSNAIQQKPDYFKAYNKRGLIFFYQQEYQKAIADYTYYLYKVPDKADVYYNRSGAWFALQDYKNALSDAEKAIELGLKVDPKYIDTLHSLNKKAPSD